MSCRHPTPRHQVSQPPPLTAHLFIVVTFPWTNDASPSLINHLIPTSSLSVSCWRLISATSYTWISCASTSISSPLMFLCDPDVDRDPASLLPPASLWGAAALPMCSRRCSHVFARLCQSSSLFGNHSLIASPLASRQCRPPTSYSKINLEHICLCFSSHHQPRQHLTSSATSSLWLPHPMQTWFSSSPTSSLEGGTHFFHSGPCNTPPWLSQLG